uniref:RecA-like resolvase n=1 Tax=Micrococcus phage Kurnik TaxID=3092208 RepID=A0AAU6R694_9CAUD
MSSISAILHGDSKAGKSTAAYSMPAPRLLIDAEKAHRWLPGRKLFWDPVTQAPPEPPEQLADGTWNWETCVVIVRNWLTFERAYQWLNTSPHPFKSVIIDSITEIQVKIKEQLTNGDLEQKLAYDGWNTVMVRTEGLSRDFRDLTEHPTNPISVAITAMTEFKDGKWRPAVQGQAGKKLPYFFDIIGYCYKERIINPMDPSDIRIAHRVLTGFDPNIIVGERVNGILPDDKKLPNVFENLNFTTILRDAFPESVV